MKKTILFLALLVLAFSLAACSSQVTTAEPTASVTVPVTTVPETAAPVQEISITTDNWHEYFEQREAQMVHVNKSGSIVLREFGYGIFLKEEYASRLAEENPVDASFEIQVNSIRYQVYGDLTTNNFIVRDDIIHDEGTRVLTASVEDYRGNARMQEGSDFHNAVGAFFTIDSEFGA